MNKNHINQPLQIDEIDIISNNRYIVLVNNRNGANYCHYLENDSIAYFEPSGNAVCNKPSIVSFDDEIINLRDIKQIVIAKNGSLAAYLSTAEVIERAEKTFYAKGQREVYNFVKNQFKIN